MVNKFRFLVNIWMIFCLLFLLFLFGIRVACVSFGGLILMLKGDATKMERLELHKKYFLCMRKV